MIAVVSVHDKKYEPLAEWTLHKNKKEYCEKHGYILEYADDGGEKVSGKPMMLPPAPETHIPIGWGKIFLMKDVFRRHPDVEWIFNTDCDVMITNLDTKIEDIVKEYAGPNTHVMIPADCNGINCGNMLVRNTPIGKAFLNTIISGMPLYRNWYMVENQLIQDLAIGSHLREDGMKPGGTLWAEVIKVLPQRVINSYDYTKLPLLKNRPNFNDILGTDGQWKKGDFLIQWPTTSLEYRIKAAKELYTSNYESFLVTDT